MHTKPPQIKKVPPFMNELVDTYNCCFFVMNKIEKCFFGQRFKSISKTDGYRFQLILIHYQLINKEKIYKFTCIQENNELTSTFFVKDSRLFLSEDASLGVMFSTDETKVRFEIFRNDSMDGKVFFDCVNSVVIKDLHKRFLLSDTFCSFSPNNQVMIYCAETEDLRLAKDSNMATKEIEDLKKINDGVYTETYGEKFDYCFFSLFMYNCMDNSVKQIRMTDLTTNYYNPVFIDATSFVCLGLRTIPFRLGIYAFNTRPNDLYLCTLNTEDIIPRNDKGKSKKNFVRCSVQKISTKTYKQIISPFIIKEKRILAVACLAVTHKENEGSQHMDECNLLLMKLIKVEKKIKEEVEETSSPEKRKVKVGSPKLSIMNPKSRKVNRKKSNSFAEFDNIQETQSSEDLGIMSYKPCSPYRNGIKKEFENEHNDGCVYQKESTEVLVTAGTRTKYFMGIYTNEIKGFCYPFIFLNTIMYCNKIIIAVCILTRKVYRILIDHMKEEINNQRLSTDILAMKENNILVRVQNFITDNILISCIFEEENVSGDFIILKRKHVYNLDKKVFDCLNKENETNAYINIQDNSRKLRRIFLEMDVYTFKGKHPFIRRRNPKFNCLYETEAMFQEHVKYNQLFMPGFEVFNSKKLRNLIVYIHGGPYGVTLNAYNSTFIFLAACGFDLLCINYVGSLSFSNQPHVLNGHVNSIEIEDIKKVCTEYILEFKDYKNIYLYGASYGAFSICCLLTKYDIFKNACLINGFYEWILASHSSDIPDFFLNLCLDRNYEFDYYYKKDDYQLVYDKSPLNFVQNIQCPVLIVCGKKDLRVSHHNSIALYNRLRALKKKCKLIEFEDCGHVIDNYDHLETMLFNVILWFYEYGEKKKQ